MKKRIIFLILIAIPLFIFASNSFLSFHQNSLGQLPQLQNDRTYRVLERNAYTWNDVSLAWDNMFKYDYHYTSGNPNRPDSITVNYWNSNSSSFSRVGVYVISYNPAGELVNNITLYYNMGLAGIIVFMDVDFSYNPEGYLIGFEHSRYHQGYGIMIPYERMHIDFISPSNYQMWGWEYQNDDYETEWYHTTYQWDNQGRIVLETKQTSPDSTEWSNDEQVSHEYQTWDTTTGTSFVNSYSRLFPFSMIDLNVNDIMGCQTQSISSSWTGNWVNDTKNTYTYNESHFLTSDMEYIWYSSYFSEDFKIEYTYDSNNNITEMISANMGATWVNEDRVTYVWSNSTANDDNVNPPTIISMNAYPNPFRHTEAVTFDTKLAASEQGKLTIYNLKGQKVKDFAVNADKTKIIWNSKDYNNQLCAAGIYFYQLSTNKRQETKKLVILK